MSSARRICLKSLALAVMLTGPAAADDLADVYRLALESDPQLRQAESAYLATGETHTQARARLLPQASLSANLMRDRLEIQSSDSALFAEDTIYSTNKGYTLSLSQALYRRDTYKQMRQSDAATAQAEAQFHAAEQDLITRAAERYFNVLAAADNVEFARAEKDANQRLLDQAQQRFEVGLIAITDVHEAQAAYDLAVAQEIAAENRLAISKEELREITGSTHDSLATLSAEAPLLRPEPENLQEWLNTASEQNFPLLAAQYAVEASRAGMEVQRSGHYPTLDLVASYDYSDTSNGRFGGSESNDAVIGLQFNLPLYQGGGVSARKREAAHRLTGTREALEQQRRATDLQTRSAYLTVLDSISSVRALNQAVISTQSALDATEAGYEVGTRTIVDVVQLQRNLFDARRNYSRARYNYVLSTLRLKSAAGLLNAEDVQQVNRWLQ